MPDLGPPHPPPQLLTVSGLRGWGPEACAVSTPGLLVHEKFEKTRRDHTRGSRRPCAQSEIPWADGLPRSPLLHPPLVFRLLVIQLVVARVPAPSGSGNHGPGLASGVVTGAFGEKMVQETQF